MGGFDPYSSSKGCCELLISSHRRSFFNLKNSACLASARAGNVIGGGDWSQDRLIPDILNSLQISESILVRNPFSVRPWQHVLDPLSGYLVLAQKLYEKNNHYAEAWNFGPREDECKPVKWIVNKMIEKWGGGNWHTEKSDNLHEAKYLKLDCSKAKTELKWEPIWNINESLNAIISWHKKWLSGDNMKDETIKQIENYTIPVKK